MFGYPAATSDTRRGFGYPNYEVYSENNGNFWKKKMYLFVYINVVAFKIVPMRYYALVPALLPILETLLKLDLCDSL